MGPTMWWRVLCALMAALIRSAVAQCPWSRELVDLHADCVCAYNSVQRLSVQCSPVNFTRLMGALHASVEHLPIDLLYVNNSTVEALEGPLFRNLEVKSLHLSRCGIRRIEDDVFSGLGRTLISLSLQDNTLGKVPTAALARLGALRELDLSHNGIVSLPSGAFAGLPLTTLKLADNMPLNISDDAFRSLEGSLKSLNLKGAGLEKFPAGALRGLGALTYLDLAQNRIADIPAGALSGLHSLSVLNLERNRLLTVKAAAFQGVNDTLNSLSLLNNLLLEFPTEALAALTEIRVLDLGFNGIRSIPDNAFQNNQYLALLALDGNPLQTIPESAFTHLNSTLRGLSIGGSYLECDCKIRWISEWMQQLDLQVTSRERNPQFCSKPDHLRRRTFAQITPSDLICDRNFTTKGPKKLDNSVPDSQSATRVEVTSPPASVTGRGRTFVAISASTPFSTTQVPTPSARLPTQAPERTLQIFEEVKMVDAKIKDSSVSVQWEADSTNLLGFLVIYRYFGETEFKRGPALDKNRRRFTLDNLPNNECIVVCVITLEDAANLAADSVPYSQCREVRTEGTQLDTIVIACSAAVCAVVVIAVIAVLCCYRRRKDTGPLPPPGALPPAAIKGEAEWETSSMYSTRSIPRAKMYHHMDNGGGGGGGNMDIDTRSHISHYSQAPNGYLKARSTADGQSHRSYSQFSNRFSNTLGNPEMRKSQQSLSQISGQHSFIGSHMSMPKKNGRLTSASSLHSLSEYNGIAPGDWHDKYRKGYGPR